mmetsp:Transcript_18296/g.44914  ORF Transcript_18296/g.44914 Transcript_18296/m.44914 type:complete len:93 (+) Transcript_18296:647-925(+)
MSDTAEAGRGNRSCAVSLQVDDAQIKFVSIHLTENGEGEAARMKQAHRILMQYTGGRSSIAKMGDLVVFGGDFYTNSLTASIGTPRTHTDSI